MKRITDDVIELLQELNDLGVTAAVVGGDRLQLRPGRVCRLGLIERVKAHKFELIDLIINGVHGDSGNGDKTPSSDSQPAIPSPSPVSPVDEGGDKKPDIEAIIEREMSRPRPPFPSPQQWIRGHGITWESVGFERYQFGGRPHCLRNDLRRLWLDEYVTSKQQGYSEPAAWDRAWDKVHERD